MSFLYKEPGLGYFVIATEADFLLTLIFSLYSDVMHLFLGKETKPDFVKLNTEVTGFKTKVRVRQIPRALSSLFSESLCSTDDPNQKVYPVKRHASFWAKEHGSKYKALLF